MSDDGGPPDGQVACADDVACDDGRFCSGVERCQAGACIAGAAPCGTGCDEASDTCGCEVPDADGDGHAALGCAGDDCDDTSALRHPGLTELCDADDVDEDCDSTTFGYRDGDDDGYLDARCCNGSLCGDDCDDSQPGAHPTLPEVCDGFDNDCDARVDEGRTVWTDADNDMFGDDGATPTSGCPGPGLADNDLDCNDGNASINPAVPEVCNGFDDNCDGVSDEAVMLDWFPDCDRDMYGDVGAAPTASCDQPPPTPPSSCPAGSWARNALDCDDGRIFIFPGAPEVCDGFDDDCASGGIVLMAEDVDGDAHAAPAAACSGGPFPKNDCDDADTTVYGGAAELCDRIDQDCSEGGGVQASEDADTDGHAAITAACANGPLLKDDCDDDEATIYGGAPELCDRRDNDCASGGGTVVAEDADSDAHAAPAASCNGGPFAKDDCDDADPARFPGAPPLTPVLLGPANGELTGSFRATGALRPDFRWIAYGDCDATHEIEIDDSCAVAGFATCGFASPEIDAAAITGTSYRPTTDLPVSTVAPVGQRYFWRVRSCSGASCSAWSTVRYLDVGRVFADFNADGYADVIVGAYAQNAGATDEGNAFVYYGGGMGIPSLPNVTLDNPGNQFDGRFGASVAAAGDVNGDGYGDVVVGAFLQDAGASNEGNAFVYYGSAAGIPIAPSATLDNPANQANASFGMSVASAGDVNADGYADIVVGAYLQDTGATDEGSAFVYYGSATGVAGPPSATLDNPANQAMAAFGRTVAGAGDVNGDGYADLLVGAHFQDAPTFDEGNAFVYYGGAAGIPSTPNRTLDNPADQATGFFGAHLASAGDLDGDGYSDLVVSAIGQDAPAIDEGNAFVYYGGAAGVPSTPDRTLDNPANQLAAAFGRGVTSGDLDGDGYSDLVVSANFQDSGATDEGSAFVYRGGRGGIPSTPSITLDNPTNQANSTFGRSMSSPGDVNGDGYDDLLVGADGLDFGATDEGGAFMYHGGAAGVANPPNAMLDNPANQASGYFGYSVASAEVVSGSDPRRL